MGGPRQVCASPLSFWPTALSPAPTPLALSLPLGHRVGWMDHRRSSCRLLEHHSAVPLLVTQHHDEQQELAAGASMAPVLMYAPALHRLLRPGHPGRAALEQLLPPEGGTWLDCVLPLPPDHHMCGWTLDQANSAGVAGGRDHSSTDWPFSNAARRGHGRCCASCHPPRPRRTATAGGSNQMAGPAAHGVT